MNNSSSKLITSLIFSFAKHSVFFPNPKVSNAIQLTYTYFSELTFKYTDFHHQNPLHWQLSLTYILWEEDSFLFLSTTQHNLFFWCHDVPAIVIIHNGYYVCYPLFLDSLSSTILYFNSYLLPIWKGISKAFTPNFEVFCLVGTHTLHI